MKGIIKKTSVSIFMVIAALAMFTTVVMAWGDDYYRMEEFIRGEYYYVGAGACLLAPGGFNNVLQPNTGESGPWNINNIMWEGIITFKDHQTGTLSGILRVVERPSYNWLSGPGGDIPDVSAANVSWNFKYKVGAHGRITFTYVPGSYVADFIYGPMKGTQSYMTITGPHYGVISPDAKNIIFTFGVPLQLVVTADPDNKILLFPDSCNLAMQGFRCLGDCPDLIYSPEPAP
jgi:hypothetical protein